MTSILNIRELELINEAGAVEEHTQFKIAYENLLASTALKEAEKYIDDMMYYLNRETYKLKNEIHFRECEKND